VLVRVSDVGAGRVVVRAIPRPGEGVEGEMEESEVPLAITKEWRLVE
jgi:hypothetical protein